MARQRKGKDSIPKYLKQCMLLLPPRHLSRFFLFEGKTPSKKPSKNEKFNNAPVDMQIVQMADVEELVITRIGLNTKPHKKEEHRKPKKNEWTSQHEVRRQTKKLLAKTNGIEK